ncbi:MAG: spoIIIJ-associated protein [Parcubacteria group bacterium Gr01-1014_70]|nr:MAG: spoIIIJ-associated protein [Parcubacteria group bacterium Gr01-1014_70]
MNQEGISKTYDDVHGIIEELLRKMNIQASVTRVEFLDAPYFDIKTEDSASLIGEGGQHLYALQTIIKRFVEQKIGGPCPPFLVDVGEYQRHRIEEIKDRARMGAQRVRYFKKEVVLQPMNSYERRIIHVALMEDPDVATESIGEGENRRVVIKPTA